MRASTLFRPLSWLNGWAWPFLWILLIPIVTVPWSYDLLQDVVRDSCGRGRSVPHNYFATSYSCSLEEVIPTLWPGLLNLVAFLWVRSGRLRVHYAGWIAGSLGVVRLAAPYLIYSMPSGAYVTILTGGFMWPAIPHDGTLIASVILWFLSLIAAIVFPFAVKGDKR